MANNVISGGTTYKQDLAYDLPRFADEAFMVMKKNLVISSLVNRVLEPNTIGQGSTVNIRKPDTFTVKDGGAFSAEDINPEVISINVDRWKSVDLALTDKELAQADPSVISHHLQNATYALAAYIDADVASLGKDIPAFKDVSGTPVVGDITDCYRQLADNNVPVNELDRLHLVMNPSVYTGYIGLSDFSQYQGAGGYGVNTQLTAQLGQRFNFNTHMSQNIQSHTAGTASTTTLALNGAASARATTVNLDAGTVTGTLAKGDVISFAGHSQKYAITSTVTASGNAFTSVGITPPLAVDVADNVVVTVYQDTHSMNLAFHRDAFALVMAPLPSLSGGQDGVNASTVISEGNISMRLRMWTDFNSSQRRMSVDALWGVKTVDPNKAVRLRG